MLWINKLSLKIILCFEEQGRDTFLLQQSDVKICIEYRDI